jgi:hypothetical protein
MGARQEAQKILKDSVIAFKDPQFKLQRLDPEKQPEKVNLFLEKQTAGL